MSLSTFSTADFLNLLRRFAKQEQRVSTPPSATHFEQDRVAVSLGYGNWSQLHKNLCGMEESNFHALVERALVSPLVGRFLTVHARKRFSVLSPESLLPYWVEYPDDLHSVMKIDVGLSQSAQPKSIVNALAESIEYAERSHNDGACTTVWIEVDDRNDAIPAFVTDAVRLMQGYGVAVVVTKGRETSLKPTAVFPQALINAIRDATRSGDIWDPVSRMLTETDPS